MKKAPDADQLHGSDFTKPAERELASFLEFIKDHGVVGLAVGIMLGGAVGSMVKSLVDGIIDPLVGLLISADNLESATFGLFGAQFQWGLLVSSLIDFLVISIIVYFGFRFLKLEKLEKKK